MNPTDEMLDVLMHDMDSADHFYQPTPFWRAALNPLITQLRDGNLSRFRSLPGPLSFFVPTYGFEGYHNYPEQYDGMREALEELNLNDARSAIHLERLLSGEAHAESDYRTFLASDCGGPIYLDRFSESNIADPVEQFEFDGKRFGRSSLNYLLGLSFLKRYCDLSSVHTVLEIGGGYGSLGEILLSDSRNDIFYIDVDIAPTIACAYHYLSQAIGQRAVLDYWSTKDNDFLEITQMKSSHRAATLASWQLPKLKGTIDLFVNFISFQEMEPAVVSNYLAHVDQLKPQYILLRNLKEGKAKAKSHDSIGVIQPITAEMYDEFLKPYSLIKSNTVPFGYRTVDGFHSELRLYQRN